MDYYATLGLKRGASDAEIKKAYRSMAMKHHPDRGGDQAKFKEISTAYDCLSDPDKRRMIDAGMDPNQSGFRHQGQQNPFEFHFNTGNLNDLFGNFGFGGGFGREPLRKNKTLNITIEITLEDVLQGKELNAEITIPNGKNKMINIVIPAGIEHGQQIRYEGMGDDSIQGIRAGDLIVNVLIKQHARFQRERTSLIMEGVISVWDAMLGTQFTIQTLDNKTLSITVPAGTQPDTVLSCRGEGLPSMRNRQRGNLLVKIKMHVPQNLSQDQRAQIQEFKQQGI
jgi:curved DNA-binding protein